MEYTREFVRDFARDASLTIDHDLSTQASLAGLSPVQIPQISPMEFQGRSIHKDPRIPRAAAMYLQELCYTSARLTSIDWQSPVIEISDCFYSDNPMIPAWEPVSISSNVQPSVVTSTSQKTQDSELIGISSDGRCRPGDEKDNPYVIEPLESQFSRISVTPDVEVLQNDRSKKPDSPLTPPNTVRPYRIMPETRWKKAAKPSDTPAAPATCLPSSSRDDGRQLPELHGTQHVSRNQVALEQSKPRKSLQKIKLDKLPQTSALASSSAQIDLKQHLEKVLEKRKVATVDIQALSWAPWTPYQFDEAAFRGRFHIETGGEAGNFFKIPQPIDSRSLLNFVGVDEEDFEPLEPIKFPHPTDSLSLTRKRKLDSINDVINQGDRPCKMPAKTQASETFENSFPGIAFGLLANRSTQLTRINVPSGVTSTLAVNTSHKKGCNVPQTLLTPTKCLPVAVSFPPGNYQIIATSCSPTVRQAIRYVRSTLQEVKVVERDFLAGWTSVEGIPGDADIILSSDVGILLTTVEEIQQHPLPGTTTQPRFYRKLLSLVPKFQTVHVLVNSKSGGNSNTILESQALIKKDERLSTTRFSIQAFDEHQGVETMYLRLVELVVQNLRPMSMDLDEEETNLEKYLRKKTGINAFAAQIVLQRLRLPGIVNDKQLSLMLTHLKGKSCLRDLQTVLDKKSNRLLALSLSGLGRPNEGNF